MYQLDELNNVTFPLVSVLKRKYNHHLFQEINLHIYDLSQCCLKDGAVDLELRATDRRKPQTIKLLRAGLTLLVLDFFLLADADKNNMFSFPF